MGTAVVVGVAESDDIGVLPQKTALQLHAEATQNALGDAGIALDEVDGLFTAGISTIELGEYLGVQPIYTDGTNVGGSSFVIHIGHAATAIASGLCGVAVISHGQSGRSRRSGPPPDLYGQNAVQFEDPWGMPRPLGAYALACSRHMAIYGTTQEQLAEIAVATRKWASLNPKALMRDPITVADVLASRLICWPLHLLDCCLVTDAGGAVVLTSKERARDTRGKSVDVLGFGEHHDHAIISQMPDLTVGPGNVSGARAFAMASVQHEDIDVAQIYDSFTYTVLLSLEDLGFCQKGEGGPFVSGQRTGPGGDFPVNTQGGGLSYTHPGMFGIFTVVEAVRQLRGDYSASGELERQVQDARLALVHGTGGMLSATGTAILGV